MLSDLWLGPYLRHRLWLKWKAYPIEGTQCTRFFPPIMACTVQSLSGLSEAVPRLRSIYILPCNLRNRGSNEVAALKQLGRIYPAIYYQMGDMYACFMHNLYSYNFHQALGLTGTLSSCTEISLLDGQFNGWRSFLHVRASLHLLSRSLFAVVWLFPTYFFFWYLWAELYPLALGVVLLNATLSPVFEDWLP